MPDFLEDDRLGAADKQQSECFMYLLDLGCRHQGAFDEVRRHCFLSK